MPEEKVIIALIPVEKIDIIIAELYHNRYIFRHMPTLAYLAFHLGLQRLSPEERTELLGQEPEPEGGVTCIS